MSATRTFGTIILAIGILWVLYEAVVVVGAVLVVSLGTTLIDFAECAFTLGLYCSSPAPALPSPQNLIAFFVLPVSVVLIGFVLRAAGPARAK
jgi:hypothetical protein